MREFWGNVPQIVKAYAWARAMGAEGITEASDLSVIANNYMEQRLLAIRGVTKSHPHLTQRRMEMTRYSLGQLTEETGVTVIDVQNRMVDFGVDAFWLSHEPWLVPEPFTPEAGEMWSKEDIDYWIAVLAAGLRRGVQRSGDRHVRSAQPARPPHGRDRPGGAGRLGHDLAGPRPKASAEHDAREVKRDRV